MSVRTLVAGYYISFATTRSLMKELEIGDRGLEDQELEWPISNWLAEKRMMHILPASICHPAQLRLGKREEDGMMLITRIADAYRKPGEGPVPEDDHHKFQQREQDLTVKTWLMENGKVGEDAMEWICIWDTQYLTTYGRVPFLNSKDAKSRTVIYEMTSERFTEWQEHYPHLKPEEYYRKVVLKEGQDQPQNPDA